MISLRCILRLLSIAAVSLLLSAQPLGTRLPAYHDSVAQNVERTAPSPLRGDFVTRKHRHAASLEEYFAVDSDSEQHVNSLARAPALSLARSIAFAETRMVPRYREWRPSHRPNAALPTGPPNT